MSIRKSYCETRRTKRNGVDAAQRPLSVIGSDDQRDFVNALLGVARVMARTNLELRDQLHHRSQWLPKAVNLRRA
jgi:hypothetical protein